VIVLSDLMNLTADQICGSPLCRNTAIHHHLERVADFSIQIAKTCRWRGEPGMTLTSPYATRKPPMRPELHSYMSTQQEDQRPSSSNPPQTSPHLLCKNTGNKPSSLRIISTEPPQNLHLARNIQSKGIIITITAESNLPSCPIISNGSP